MATNNGGAVQSYSPGTLSGEVVQPTSIASAQDNLGHQFFQVLRHLILHSGAYHNETDQTAHLAVVSRYENALGGSNMVSEDDHAPREDVNERIAPQGQNVRQAPVAASPAIDYAQLARAIVAVQNEQANKTDDTPAKD
jgi:hypothetical protein